MQLRNFAFEELYKSEEGDENTTAKELLDEWMMQDMRIALSWAVATAYLLQEEQ